MQHDPWKAVAAIGAALFAAQPAEAREVRSLHDIPWYQAHDSVRAVTIDACRKDHALGRLPDCANAETAETRVWAERASQGGKAGWQPGQPLPDDYLTQPSYWAANGLQRVGVLGACEQRVTMWPADVCQAARAGASMSNARKF